MNIEQIQSVLAVAEYHTFLEAAFQLNRSQSSVSKSIQSLELELGLTLFERTTRKVNLTPAGCDFLVHAQAMMDAYAAMLRSAEEHLSQVRRQLRIGSIYFGLNNRLAPLIAHYAKGHPSVEIEIKEDTTTPLLHALDCKKLDVVFVSSMYGARALHTNFSADSRYRSLSCFQDPYFVVVSREHPFAGLDSLIYEDLRGQKFITTDRTMDVYHEAVARVLAEHGVTFDIAMHCSNVRSVLHMVAENLGIALLSKLVVEQSDELRLIPIQEPLIRDTQMLVLNEKALPPLIRNFYQSIADQIAARADPPAESD